MRKTSGTLTKAEETPGMFERDFPFLTSPFSLMRHFSEEMDRFFSESGILPRWRPSGLLRWPREARETRWMPDIEMFTKDGKFIVRADLPGLTKNDVKVEITEEALTIQGERHDERERKEAGYYQTERSYGAFYRTVRLPEGVKTDTATASFHDGVLEVTMGAPVAKAGGRRIEIGTEPGKTGDKAAA